MVFFEDPAERIQDLVDRLERRIRIRFLEQLTTITDQSTLLEIRRQLTAGNIAGALAQVELAARNVGAGVTGAYVLAGEEAAKFISEKLQVGVLFDQVNVRAVQAMQANQLRFVTGFTQQQTAATRRALEFGIERGLGPRTIAREIKDSIGLTPKQVQYVENYRRALERGDSGALQRRLRDRRFDPSVRRAIRDGKPLSADKIDQLVGRYRERWISHRATVIARTEGLRSAHEGTQEMYRQAVEVGRVNGQTLTRGWLPTSDERTRDHHESMRGQTVQGFEEPFVTGLGNFLLYPGDSNAPAVEVAQCRCAVTTRFEAAAQGVAA